VWAEANRAERRGVIQVSVEVGGDSGRFSASVRAETIEQAVSLASTRYAGSEVRVLFPIDPESFFVGDQGPAGVPISLEMPEEKAG
jgi:hypothetical protein